MSQFDLQTAENNLLTAKAQLAQAEAQRVNAANNLSYTVVKAPSNGVVGSSSSTTDRYTTSRAAWSRSAA